VQPGEIGKFGGEVLRECSKTVSDFLPTCEKAQRPCLSPRRSSRERSESFSLVPKKARDPAWRKVTKFSSIHGLLLRTVAHT